MSFSDFSQPQRQSPVGILVMFFYTLQQYLRALWPMLVIWIFKFDEVNKLYLALGTIAVILLIGIVSYLKYLNFTFFLDEENQEFIITEGILNKTKTTIQLNKIQQVNINQSLIQKFIGVYALDVDTAGSSKKEGSIKAISHELALELKSRLLENERKEIVTDLESGQSAVAEANPEEHPFIKISFITLLKVGITSNYLRSFGLLILFVSTIYENMRNFTERDVLEEQSLEHYIDGASIFKGVLILVTVLFLIVLLINLVRVVFKYFDYKIAKQKGSLLLSFGLLNTKSTIIKPEKVQITTVTRNFFQKKMDILEIKIKQATSGEPEEKKSAIEIPGCSETERDQIMKLLYKTIPKKGVQLQPNFRKLVFSIFTTIVIPLSLYFAFANWIESEAFEFIYLVPVYSVFIGLVLYFGFRNYRLFISDNFIIKQSGAWDVDNEIIEPMKIQAITTSQLFWHKKADIGSIILHTAGGNVAFQLGDFTRIKHYVNLWLYEIETSDSNWM
ncbi:putative membrane protein [Flavobacterium arsenatis]|uniref:Membrane protein n=1 Tax=Flavobacterium arsenatis TaxID=1484332 RepID=A0ABU1TTY3_9FLAO|nr:PH domain-containing protein [Flavobacterium arsenatis]MDR6969344.1 putative membrane protein [Flavobacterium arsenatis]